jgi:AcrR family transcriptional regulator
MEHGSDVTTRQIADAAGVAEGTLFRVFEDKQAIIDAVVSRFMDPAPTAAAIAALDPELPLERLVAELVTLITARFQGVMGIMSALGLREPPQAPTRPPSVGAHGASLIFEHHRDRLRVDPALAVQLVRMLCFAKALPAIETIYPVTNEELAEFVVNGITKEGA